MSLQEKLDSARNALHGTTVDFDQFLKSLAFFFGYGKTLEESDAAKLSDDDLQAATWEDLIDCGCPKGKARQIAKIFRGAEPVTSNVQKVVIEDPVHQAESMTPAELVTKYSPEFATNPFGKKLKEISGGQRFVVFNNDGSVNVSVSQNLLQELLDNYPERQSVVVEGNVHQTYAVGDRPSRYADENPVYPGTLLRPDGSSDKDIKWTAVPLNVRQLLYIAVRDTHELNMGKYEEQDIFDLVSTKSFADVAKRYQKAALRFKELSETNQLPQLKVKLGGVGGKMNNPFTTGHRVW